MIIWSKLNRCRNVCCENNLVSISYLLLVAAVFLAVPTRAEVPASEVQPIAKRKSAKFTVFPVGINIKQRNVDSSALIKGAENGSTAIALKQWLIPFDTVVKALNLKVTTLEGGKLELRSPGIVTRINPQILTTDPDLGLAWRISQIEKLLGVTVQFDLTRYAVVFDPPWLDLKQNSRAIKPEVDITGLTKIDPDRFTFTSIGQRLRLYNRDIGDRDFDASSDLSFLGTAWGGSWYLNIDQIELNNFGSWQLGELQYLRQTERVDYAFGSQFTFWQSSGENQYWGLTRIQRFGFTPDSDLSPNGFNADLRRQPQAIDRTVAGLAQPGDIVQLVTRRGEIVREIIVGETGQYQFDNVNARQNDYQVLIYPNGRLTIAPEVRELVTTYVSGQLTKGTSTFATSLGINRNFLRDSFWGDFSDVGGGVNYRLGVSEELTLGTGFVVDGSLFGLGELFFQPKDVPLQLGFSALINPEFNEADYTAYFNYQPTDRFNINFNGNGSNRNLRFDWRATPNLSLRLGNDNLDNVTTGFTFNRSFWLDRENNRQFSWSSTLDYGDRTGLSQRLNARYSNWQLAHQGTRTATTSRLNYYLSSNAFNSKGQSLFLGYDTRSSSNSNNVINLGWQYRSAQNASDGGSLWDVELGYGFNARGSAPLAALTTRALPGTTLRLSYQGISPENNDSQIQIDIFPNLRLQGRPSLGDRNFERLRTKGGILVRPFIDLNTNGKLDPGEHIDTEDAELLLQLNYESLETIDKDITSRGIYIPVDPGEHRLDLDSAGYPLNSQPTESSYGLEVTAGSYTKLDIPFRPAYTAIGVVTDRKGVPVAGARVEAISTTSKRPILSVTNSAGVYFLEGLSQSTYRLSVNDRPVDLEPLTLTADSEPLQEINLQIDK